MIYQWQYFSILAGCNLWSSLSWWGKMIRIVGATMGCYSVFAPAFVGPYLGWAVTLIVWLHPLRVFATAVIAAHGINWTELQPWRGKVSDLQPWWHENDGNDGYKGLWWIWKRSLKLWLSIKAVIVRVLAGQIITFAAMVDVSAFFHCQPIWAS